MKQVSLLLFSSRMTWFNYDQTKAKTKNHKTKIQLILFVFLLSLQVNAQASTSNPDLGILVFSTKSTDLSNRHKEQLSKQVGQVFSKNGIYDNRGSVFGVYPEFYIYEQGKIEGIGSMVTLKGELTLRVKNLLTGAVIATLTQTIKGAGNDKNGAINRAINTFKGSKSRFREKLNDLKAKMSAYYLEESDNLLASAEIFMQNRSYKKAIAYLSPIPQEAECYASAQAQLEKAYAAFQSQQLRPSPIRSQAAICAAYFYGLGSKK